MDKPEPIGACPLCGRPMLPGPSIDRHHLIPRARGGKEQFVLHRVCHSKIHATLDEGTLARSYHTWEALRGHPEIAKFIRWVATKPPEFNERSRWSRERRGRR